MDGLCFTEGMVTTERAFQGGEGVWVEAGVGEDWVEAGWFMEVDSGGFFFRKLWVVGSEERM